MSPVEWLHFITPFIVITIIISLIACVPVTRAWRQQLQLPKKPLAFNLFTIKEPATPIF